MSNYPRQGIDLNNGVYGTPDDFLYIINKEFNIEWDLAADKENAVVDNFYSLEENSLAKEWHKLNGWLWLNPPYKNIGEWAEKCAREAEKGAKILFLVPASVGSNWYRDWVYNKAHVRFLNGRLTFKGHKAPYPKDLLLAIYGLPADQMVWNWRNN